MTQVPPQQPPQQPVPQAAPVTAAAPAQALKRPGGLTAMAVLNFVFGGLGIITYILFIVGIIAAVAILNAAIQQAQDDGDDAKVEEIRLQMPNMSLSYVVLLLGLISSALLIVSGVGYLTMSRAAGYLMGMAYGILAIIAQILWITVGNAGALGIIIGLAYPVLTIVLLNTAFKKYWK